VARVLGGDQIDLFENTEPAQADVFEIADGRGDDVQDPSHVQCRGLSAED
jgi:hypothetical protein